MGGVGKRIKSRCVAWPGARKLIAFLKFKDVKVFSMTRRSQEEPTLKNSRAALDPDETAEHVFCKNEQPGWGATRRPAGR